MSGHVMAEPATTLMKSRRRIAAPRVRSTLTLADYIRDLRQAKWGSRFFAWQQFFETDVRFGSKADISECPSDVRFTPKSRHSLPRPACPPCANSRHSPIKVMSEIRRLPLLRGSLTERFVLRQERGRTPSIVRRTPFSYLVGLPDVYRAFILIAHADRQTTSQGSELRPYNWDISVEGER